MKPLLMPAYGPSERRPWRAMLAALVTGGVMLGLLATGARETIAATTALPESVSTNLHTRIFRVDPKIFAAAIAPLDTDTTNAPPSLDRTGGGLISTTSVPTDVARIQDATRRFFAKLGVDLQPPKALFFNDRQGVLFIHATLADMEVIDQAIQVFIPPQVHIQAKLVEVPMDVDVDGTIFNSLKFARTNFVSHPQSGDKSSLTSNLLTGILTAPQAEGMLKALERQKGVNIIKMPEVTTVSGRQAQLRVVTSTTNVTGAIPFVAPGINTNIVTGGEPLSGPTLDVIPYLSADGYTVQMNIFPTVTEFLGYDDPASGYQWSVDRPVKPLPLPRFKVRQVTTRGAAAYDGQTIVIIGFVTETVTWQPNDSEIRPRDPQTQKKQLVIFITPTLIDPAGNRVHSDEELSRLPNTAPKLQNRAPALPPIPPGIPVDGIHMREF